MHVVKRMLPIVLISTDDIQSPWCMFEADTWTMTQREETSSECTMWMRMLRWMQGVDHRQKWEISYAARVQTNGHIPHEKEAAVVSTRAKETGARLHATSAQQRMR